MISNIARSRRGKEVGFNPDPALSDEAKAQLNAIHTSLLVMLMDG